MDSHLDHDEILEAFRLFQQLSVARAHTFVGKNPRGQRDYGYCGGWPDLIVCVLQQDTQGQWMWQESGVTEVYEVEDEDSLSREATFQRWARVSCAKEHEVEFGIVVPLAWLSRIQAIVMTLDLDVAALYGYSLEGAEVTFTESRLRQLSHEHA